MKKTSYPALKKSALVSAIACSALYLGHLQLAYAQAYAQHYTVPTISSYGQASSAWNNIFLNIDTAPVTFANYRAPKIQFNSAKTSLGLRLGYRLNPNLSVSSYYGKTSFGQPEAASFSTGIPFAPKFGSSRFASTHAGIDLAAHVNLLKRLTLFGSAGIATYSHTEAGYSNINGKLARVGLGLHYDLNTRLGLRVEMERLRPFGAFNSAIGADGGLDNYSLGAVFKF
jgi:hypothetical protein